jgi:polyisoprenoid-binding protein YceI
MVDRVFTGILFDYPIYEFHKGIQELKRINLLISLSGFLNFLFYPYAWFESYDMGYIWIMKKIRICFFFGLFLLISGNTPAQTLRKVSLIPEQSEMKIQGTSNLTSWEEQIQHFNISFTPIFSKNEVSGIGNIHASIKTASIVSDYKSMTRKTHQSLKSRHYPNIEFLFVSLDEITSQKGEFSATISGNVTIAGITKKISLPFSGIVKGNQMDIKGSASLNMDDFRIKPPTAMLGIIKAEKDVTITFNLLFYINR